MRSLRTFNFAPFAGATTRGLNTWDVMSQFDDMMKSLESEKTTALPSLDFAPRVDVHDLETLYRVHVDLPGVAKEDIKVAYEDGLLTISGERKFDKSENGHFERQHGKFSRSFTLPETIDADAIAAKYEAGVLSVDVPKTAKEKRKQITVQ